MSNILARGILPFFLYPLSVFFVFFLSPLHSNVKATSSLIFSPQVIPVNQAGAPIGEIPFARTGLLGFVGPVRSRRFSVGGERFKGRKVLFWTFLGPFFVCVSRRGSGG